MYNEEKGKGTAEIRGGVLLPKWRDARGLRDRAIGDNQPAGPAAVTAPPGRGESLVGRARRSSRQRRSGDPARASSGA